ncbi:MAG TPA: ABC transporter permease, partial [Armatimonadota bacterium]|nr:ABC transporter permease [Armatimonadota bacterium]
MEYLRLAVKNLLRRKTRTLLTLVGIGVAIAVLYSLLEFQRGYERGLNAEINQLGAQIMVVPKGCPYEAATIVLHGGKWPRYMEESYFEKIIATPGVSQAAPILMDAMINPATHDNKIFLGITEAYGALRPAWQIDGAAFSGPAAREVILGTSIAEKLRLKPGDTFRLRQDAAGRAAGKDDADLTVVGVLART